MQDAIAGLYRRKVEQGGVKAGDKYGADYVYALREREPGEEG